LVNQKSNTKIKKKQQKTTKTQQITKKESKTHMKKIFKVNVISRMCMMQEKITVSCRCFAPKN